MLDDRYLTIRRCIFFFLSFYTMELTYLFNIKQPLIVVVFFEGYLLNSNELNNFEIEMLPIVLVICFYC